MAFSIITAKDSNNGIGINNKLPWNIPDDLKWFRKQTKGKTVIMGSNTYFSLPATFRPLPQRENIVLTSDNKKREVIENEGGKVFGSIDEILLYCNDNTLEYFIIGGSNIYHQFINIVDKIYLTNINKQFECDTFFPKINNTWKSVYKSNTNKIDDYEYYFEIIEKHNKIKK